MTRLLVVLAMLFAACGGESEAASGGREGELHVFAAASLTEAFAELADVFEQAHPDATVTVNFGSSTALAQQINEGAPADVFASADEPSMATVIDAGRASDPVTIARNRLAIVVEPGNPKRIERLADLARSDVVLVLCAPEVPCGRFAAAALAKADVVVEPASLEENVKAVVAKVTLGEADAGIVYATDVMAAGGEAEGIDLDGALSDDPALEARYPMAITTSATAQELAEAWVELVRSDEGQRVLAEHGFLAP